MNSSSTLDGILMQWGERLFYPASRLVKVAPPPRLTAAVVGRQAAAIRRRIEATVTRRAPQVMVKVTGGGRGMAAIAAHFRYISKNGRLEIEDDRGVVRDGKDALRDLGDQWQLGGSRIDELGHRRETYNIMLSMPRGTDPLIVQRAAREFAQDELADNRYVMVLHDHQANPHVHLSVRAESKHGKRLNPRKTDLHRWRETFAEKLRGWGIEAEATRQAVRGQNRRDTPLWRLKASADGRLRAPNPDAKSGDRYMRSRVGALDAWAHIAHALGASNRPEDKALAADIARFVRTTPFATEHARKRQRELPKTDHARRDHGVEVPIALTKAAPPRAEPRRPEPGIER